MRRGIQECQRGESAGGQYKAGGTQTCLHIRITWEVFRKFLSLTLHDFRPWIHILDTHDELGIGKGW